MNGHPMRPGTPLVLEHVLDRRSGEAARRDADADVETLGVLAEAVGSARRDPAAIRTTRRGDAPVSWIHEDAFGRLRIAVVAGAASDGDRAMLEIEVVHQPSDDDATRRVVVETIRPRSEVDYGTIMGPSTLERLAELLSSAATSIEEPPPDEHLLGAAVHAACAAAIASGRGSGTTPEREDFFIMTDATPFTPSTLKVMGRSESHPDPDLPPIAMLRRPARGCMRLSPMVHMTRTRGVPDAMEIMRSTALLLDLYGKDPTWRA